MLFMTIFLLFSLSTLLSTCNCVVSASKSTYTTTNSNSVQNFSHAPTNSKFVNFETVRAYVDKKKYFAYKMDSGLEVIIIQDVNVKIAAAAMTVNSGVNKEGKDIYGLAHYCEHMLFLGSKKYTNPTYFVDYITQHGGKFNGFTDFETTGFFFKINSDKFEHGIDIFSRFFIDPLFSAEYVKKEVNSVNSEYERNIQLDSKRKEMILREIADKESLFHRFSTGNTKTLWNFTKNNNIDLRERVLEYYHLNYRPDNMKLVVYGDKSIEFYKKLIKKNFSDMKKPSTPYNPTALGAWNKLPWEFNNIGKLVLLKTINNHQDLDISILLEDVFATLPNNPGLYYKTLLNYRGKGSLDDTLRKMGLVAGIKSNLRRTYKGFSFFKLRGYITKNGIENLDKVLETVFKYIQFVRKRAVDRKLYDYVKRVYDIAFFFNNKKQRVIKYMKGMCINTWKYSKKFLFTQHKILNEYDEDVIKKFGDRLILKNAIVMVGNREFDESMLSKYKKFVSNFDKFTKLDTETVLHKQDPFYHTYYNKFDLKQNFVLSVDSGLSNSRLIKVPNELKLFASKKKLPNNISLIKTCPVNKKKQVI